MSLMSDYVEYGAWAAMCTRCHNPKHRAFRNYGARGIRVCDEWRGKGGFLRFISHVGRRPSSEHELDRIDNRRGYEPGNVRWVTRDVNLRNRSDNVLITARGKTLCVKDWAAQLGMHPMTIYSRIRRGHTGEAALRAEHYPRNAGRVRNSLGQWAGKRPE